MDDESLCLRFLKNPTINPKNGVSKLIKDTKPYLNYIKLCRSLGYNDEVDELLGISNVNKIGLFGLVDIDQNIILNSDYDGIIKLLTADQSSRNLVYKLLPQIIKNNNINTNNNLLSISVKFLHDLLELGEVELIKRSWKILDDEDYANEIFDELGSNLHEEDQIIIENYFKSSPKNYNWDVLLDHYLDKECNESLSMAVNIEYINKILKAAISVKNNFIVDAIKNYWEDEYLNILSKELSKMRNLLELHK